MVVGPLAQETQVAKLEGWDQTTVPQAPIWVIESSDCCKGETGALKKLWRL